MPERLTRADRKSWVVLFTTILGAFIIESKRLLQEDQQAVMIEALTAISAQLADCSQPAFQMKESYAPAFTIEVNALLLTSIRRSMIAALTAVPFIQWVNAYDDNTTDSGQAIHARRRHFRCLGLRNYHLRAIIALLPFLLYSSVALFAIGLMI